MTRRACLLLTLTILAGCASAPASERPSTGGPLVVVLVVDQMRSEYLETLGPRFTGGFRRLMDEGAWFRNGGFPYLNTVTCAGHATIGTGALPYRHGMVLNAWWDRETASLTPCTTDSDVKNIGYMGTPSGGDSAEALLVPTLADRLRDTAGGRSVALSLKPRSAIGLAGRNPDAVLWFDSAAGWATSTAFARKPVGWVQAFIDRNPLAADKGKTWERMLPPESYRGDDDVAAETTGSAWTRVFPHPVGVPETQFLAQWQRSPLADEYLGRLAAHAVDTLNLGRRGGTDFIGVSFSTLDYVGHQFGPESHEAQDVLFRLDRTIGQLLDHLDARLGRDGYVVALSADHGVASLPELTGGSRQSSTGVIAAIDAALAPILGAGKYVARTVYTDVYLAPGALDRVRQSPAATTAVLDALRALPGVAHAFMASEISGPEVRQSDDPVKRAAALSYYAPRSGDIIIIPERHWLLSTAATTHGTLYPYDQRVPVMFYGAGVKPGVNDGAATPADIAPTLAFLAGVPFTAADGVVLLKR